MRLAIDGHITIGTPRMATEHKAMLLSRLELALAQEESGALTRKANAISYHRGYALERFSSNRLALFDPGEVSVEAEDERTLVVRYRLGLRPTYISFGGMAAAAIILLLLKDVPRWSVMPLVGFAFIFFCGLILWGVFRVRRWLRAMANSIVAEDPAGG